MGEEDLDETAARYVRFADTEAHARSPIYEGLARAVAGDRETLGFLSTLPDIKRQPNLLLAAMRHLFGTPTGWGEFRQALLAHPDSVRSLMLERSTQTNEPGRCAALLPVLARFPQPLALLEVGTSAGLCLMPDLYGYDYGRGVIRAPAMASEPPVFRCSASKTTPLPTTVPHVVWRAGLDLSPIDAAVPAQVAWLETLVWPEQTARLANLRAAVKVATSVKPRVVKGDLRGGDLVRLCSEAPRDATLVVFHTAVLDYVSDPAECASLRIGYRTNFLAYFHPSRRAPEQTGRPADSFCPSTVPLSPGLTRMAHRSNGSRTGPSLKHVSRKWEPVSGQRHA
ncbi:DUF2332 domain-containing protein [Mesorhizobium sp.]|uniref:DUF2332 domain-containing protein n=1 Tax=Mesorhizobium sp. TaxID=1871066 RepID=UPI0025DAAB86|nr:DUF2332 domain-containing protein [Mesorhizobium sp.]